MSQTKIEKLTPEQEAMIPVYREKWKQIALSTKPINRHKAKEAVEAAYAAVGKSKPEVVFFDSPYTAANTIFLTELENSELVRQLWTDLENDLKLPLNSQLRIQLGNELDGGVRQNLQTQLFIQLCSETERLPRCQLLAERGWQLDPRQWSELCHMITPVLTARDGVDFDFYICVLNCTHDARKWLSFQSLLMECGWIYPFEQTCIVCDHPVKLSFDHQNRLHAEGEPALQFADGYSLYSYHGVTLPEKYGNTKSQSKA